MNTLVTTRKRLGHVFERKKDVKGLGGKGCLTNAEIDTLQNYFGIVLRENVGGINKMISACKASMLHVAGYHDNCPKNQNLWFQYQQDMLTGTSFYKGKGRLPLDVRTTILPCTTIYVNKRIYQNVCMGVHKTKMKVLME